MPVWQRYERIALMQPAGSDVWVCPLDVDAIVYEYAARFGHDAGDRVNFRQCLYNGVLWIGIDQHVKVGTQAMNDDNDDTEGLA